MSGSTKPPPPSLSRTVTLPLALPPGTTLRFPTKDPYDTLDFTLDITAYLAEIDDTVDAWSAQCLSQSLQAFVITQAQEQSSESLLTIEVSGGVNCQDYPILFLITTNGGRTISRTIWMLVQQVSAEYQFGIPPIFVMPPATSPPTPPSSKPALKFNKASNSGYIALL
jgi:hypothetical protein